MAFEKGQKLRVIGEGLICTVLEVFGSGSGPDTTYKVKAEDGNIELLLPGDALAPVNAPIHWYVYNFRKYARKHGWHIILLGKPKKKPFIAVYANDYNELKKKRDIIYNKLKGTRRISWFMLIELDLNEDPIEIEVPVKPDSDWYIKKDTRRPFRKRPVSENSNRSSPDQSPRRAPRPLPPEQPRRAPRALPPLSPKSSISTNKPPPPPPSAPAPGIKGSDTGDSPRPKRPRIKKPPLKPPTDDQKPE